MKRNIYILLTFLFIIIGCKKNDSNPVTPEEGNLKIVVFSDPHYYSPSLGSLGQAFQAYLMQDTKLLAESKAITESLINSVIAENPDIVLIPGDLTKDGELISHQEFAGYLKQLKDKGIKVYVIPGNHDINNPHSFSYNGATQTKVETITEGNFVNLYNDYGYKSAIARDPNSLSYVAEINSTTWVIGIDASRYRENTVYPLVGGKLSTQTFAWVKEKLQEAKNKKINVLAMMHHGLVEHFTGQKSNPISEDYVIDDWQNVANEFANLGLKVIFTGHHHANDITKYTNGSNSLYDIETGSTVNFPCPYRVINYTANKLTVDTKYITSINFNLNGMTFQNYAEKYLDDGMSALINYMLVSQYQTEKANADFITPYLVGALKAHYKGDEKIPSNDVTILIATFMASSDPVNKLLGQTLQTLYIDLPPLDNNIVINF